MARGTDTITPALLEELRRLQALEGQIVDLVRASRVADIFVDNALGVERAEEQSGVYLFRLHEYELADIAFLLCEVTQRCRALDDAFHASR